MKIVATTKTITPDLALELLDKNTCNRPARERKIKEYSNDMRNGKWRLNGEPIIFSDTDVLLDGQNRLWACIDAEKSFSTLVVSGVPEDVFPTINTGIVRSPGDVLFIGGLAMNRNTVAAATAIVLKYYNNSMFSNTAVARAELLEYALAHPKLVEWCHETRRHKKTRPSSAALAVVLHLGAHRYPAHAKEFWEGFVSGANLPVGSPILTLLNRLGADKNLSKVDRAAFVVIAWNAFVAGKTLFKLMPPRKDFPVIAGAPTK